jgi:hypothetical protein
MTDCFDPRGEYTRVCPYCRESFVADHLSRFYCPDKFGSKNYCKNRQKRIMDNIRKSGGVILVHEKNPVKVFIEDPIIEKNNIDELIKVSQKDINCKILNELLGAKTHAEISEIELKQKGFDLNFFDSFESTKSGVNIFFLDRYCFLKNVLNNLIYITLKQEYYGAK